MNNQCRDNIASDNSFMDFSSPFHDVSFEKSVFVWWVKQISPEGFQRTALNKEANIGAISSKNIASKQEIFTIV